MATTSMPAEQSQTKPNNQGGVTVVSVLPTRKVTYVFKAVTSSNLSIPVAVAVDGKVLPKYATKALRVNGGGGRLEVTALQGQRVHLFLNSDACPDWRTQPVYALVAGDRDAVVTITEKKGLHADPDTPVRQPDPDPQAEAAKKVDLYAAPLTGDIWMKVSHRYSEDEVDARLPKATSPAVSAAIKAIYRGLSQATLTVTEPASGAAPARSVSIRFEDASNPKSNITNFSLLKDGLPRVHPAGFAALINAALESGAETMLVSSCWRPLMGSIAHRAGLGLDVSVLGGFVLNREELRKAVPVEGPKRAGNLNDKDAVSEAEIAAFGEYQDAILTSRTASQAEDNARRRQSSTSGSANDAQAAHEELAALGRKREQARAVERSKRIAWNEQRDKNEPATVRKFRGALFGCDCVKQVFDPWFMDQDVRDGLPADPNTQATDNETTHSHHLHITIADPKIL